MVLCRVWLSTVHAAWACHIPVDAFEESIQVTNGRPLIALTTHQVWELSLRQADRVRKQQGWRGCGQQQLLHASKGESRMWQDLGQAACSVVHQVIDAAVKWRYV